ncbi:MAG: serine/threonine protein kinase [Ktedonobacteraceae bacterium]
MSIIYTTGKRIDHYQIMRPLGRGGASHVYLAQDWYALHEVVLKFPDDALIGGAAVFERYKREAEIGRRLNHQYIQRHLNQDEHRSAEFLVLEYMRGRTLRMVVEKGAPGILPTGEVLRMLIQVCCALAYVHEHGVIHRDIKPENIMLLENGDIKIFDFGIALLEGERKRYWPGFSPPIGTPDYMAPERLLGESGDVRSDIYGVGVVLYELLCGRTPFEEEDGFALISTHISHDPPCIVQFNPILSPALVTIVMRAIRRDPEQRYTSIQELLYDLQHLDDVTVVDYIPNPPRIGGRYRQAIRLALLVLIVCLCIVAFGVLAQYAHHHFR